MISEADVALRVGDVRKTAEVATSLCQPGSPVTLRTTEPGAAELR